MTAIVATFADVTQAEAMVITGRIREWVQSFPAADVKQAYQGRVWIAMGYESWTEWCDSELDGFRLPAVERREIVAELAESGMSNRAIADVIGVTDMTVGRDLSTATNVAVDLDRRTIGKDGRARPAAQPAPKQEPRQDPPPEPPTWPQRKKSTDSDKAKQAAIELQKGIENVERIIRNADNKQAVAQWLRGTLQCVHATAEQLLQDLG